MLMNFVIRTIINGIALWIAAFLIDGIEFGQGASTGETVTTVLLVALVFGVLNTFVRPIAKLLSLPFIILTLGLFVFIVNALMLWLTSWLGRGPRISRHHVRLDDPRFLQPQRLTTELAVCR